MKKVSCELTLLIIVCTALSFIAAPQLVFAANDALSTEALVGRWGNSGVRYGFSDDGYFYRSTTFTHMNSVYIPGITTYSGGYAYTTLGRWNNTLYYTYLNTLFGRYRVKGGVILFEDVISISHTSFDRDWYLLETRGEDVEKLQEKFQKAEFSDDFEVEFEFISPTRLRLRDENSDKDYLWELKDVMHDVPVPPHVIPPVEWPAVYFSPDMPILETKGRLREVTSPGEAKNDEETVRIIIDKTDALADIRGYVKTLRGAGWWVEEPKDDAKNLKLDARKGLWRLEIKNGSGSSTSNPDTVVIESILQPQGKWPQAWSSAGVEPPQKSIIIGNVQNKTSDNRNISEKLYFDGVDDIGVEDYAAFLRQIGFEALQEVGEKWGYMKYTRLEGVLYRAEIALEKRYGDITVFDYNFKYFKDDAWPAVWSEGGLTAPNGFEAITGTIDIEKWNDKSKWGSSFSSRVKFLGVDKNGIDGYFEELQSKGFVREQKQFSDRVTYFNYLRLGGGMYRVAVEQWKNSELADIEYTFRYFEDGEWPAAWSDGGLRAPKDIVAIVGPIDIEKWNDKNKWSNSFTASVKFLGVEQSGIDAYFEELQTSGFMRKEDSLKRVSYVNHLRLGGGLHRVEAKRGISSELAEVEYIFRYYEDGEWPTAWSNGGLTAPKGSVAIVGPIDIEKWNDKSKWGSSFTASLKFLSVGQSGIDEYFKELQTSGFVRKEDGLKRVSYVNHLRLGGSLHRVEAKQGISSEIAEIEYVFRYYEDGEWPKIWSEGGLPAPHSSMAIVGPIDMTKWGGSFSVQVKFLGVDQNEIDAYFEELETSGFERKVNSLFNRVSFSNQLRLGGSMYRVLIEQQDNREIVEVKYTFNPIL